MLLAPNDSFTNSSMLRLFIEPYISNHWFLRLSVHSLSVKLQSLCVCSQKTHTGNVSGEISRMDVNYERSHNYHYTNPASQFHFHLAAALCIARCQMMHVCGFTPIIKKKLCAHASLYTRRGARNALKFVNLPHEHKEKLRPFCIYKSIISLLCDEFPTMKSSAGESIIFLGGPRAFRLID